MTDHNTSDGGNLLSECVQLPWIHVAVDERRSKEKVEILGEVWTRKMDINISIIVIIIICTRQITISQSYMLKPNKVLDDRVQPKFGFGYGAETDLTYGFSLVSATAKVQLHKFGFGRNITPQCRNCKIGANCNTVAVCQLGYWL